MTKPAITFGLPLTLVRTFYLVCQFGDVLPCPSGFPITVPDDPASQASFFGLQAQAFVQSPLGDPYQFGDFPPVVVTLLAFGAIPVTATVQISQPRQANGEVTPLTLAWASIPAGYPRDTVLDGYEDYGPAPYELNVFSPAPHLTGPVTVTVSGVRVDGVALDVGATCATTTTLDLTAQGGWTDYYGYTPTSGEPGEYNPFSVPSYLHADIDIPPFGGCVDGGEDLDPLLTGLVSSPHNHLDVVQRYPLNTYACLPRNADPSVCYTQHVPVVDPADLPPPPPLPERSHRPGPDGDSIR